MQHWQKIPIEGVRPAKRSSHAAVCLGIDGNHPQLLVLQGRSETYGSMNDVWMLDLKSWGWKEVCCVRACVRACMRACVRACVHACVC